MTESDANPSRPPYVFVSESLRSAWTEATAQPVGFTAVLKIALAILITLPLLALFLVLVAVTIVFGVAMLIVGWVWGAVRGLFRGGRDGAGRENVRVIARQR